MSSRPVADARHEASIRGLRARDVAMLVPALALGFVLVAAHQSDRTGSPLSQVLGHSALSSLIPGAEQAPAPADR